MSDDPSPDGPTEGKPAGESAPEELEAAAPAAEESALAEAIEPPPISDAAEAYHQRARLAEDRLAEVLAAYRKLKVENEGYRDRLSRSLERRFEQRREALLLKFIDILDNLDRALEAAEVTYAGEPLIEGLILVRTQLLQTLQEQGLERIPVLGLPYDPNFSEAVETQQVEDPDHHQVVVKELLRGYRLNGRVARPSRVVVGEYPGAETVVRTPAPSAGSWPPRPLAPDPTPPDPEPTLEEIIARAEAQEALFPDAFSSGDEDEQG